VDLSFAPEPGIRHSAPRHWQISPSYRPPMRASLGDTPALRRKFIYSSENLKKMRYSAAEYCSPDPLGVGKTRSVIPYERLALIHR
jgi:hypothetical protein